MIQKLKETANKDFFKRVLVVALPATLQYLLNSSRNLVDTIMIGKLGVEEVAAVGAAGKPFFVLIIVLFGISGGTSILTSQYWGKKDGEGVSKNVLLSMMLSLCFSVPFFLILNTFSKTIVGFASDNPEVISLGSEYLKIVSINMVIHSLMMSQYVGLRSTNQASKCTAISAIGVISNILLNYILIFGKLGFPALGLKGAALGTLISAVIECTVLTFVTFNLNNAYKLKVAKLSSLLDKEDIRKLLNLSIPIGINGLLWAGGVYIYFIIYGKIGSNELAIMTMLGPLDSFSVAFFSGVATGASVLLGHSLGNKEFQKAWRESWVFICLGLIIGFVIMILFYLGENFYLGLYTELDKETMLLASKAYKIFLVMIIFKSINVPVIVGILRSGGDTKFVLFLDLFSQWLVGIPLGFLGVFLWGLPLHWVFALIAGEEFVKIFVSLYRVKSKKWINNLVG